MYAYTNILAALIQRGRTGKGCRIDVSMLESMVEWMSYPLYYAFDGATPPPRAGAAHATIYPYGPFPAGDGKTVMLGLQNEREWVAFCQQVLRRPELATDERFASNSRRTANRQALRAIIVEAFAALSAEQVIARLDEAQIANARMNDMHDVWKHPQLQARGRWTEVRHADRADSRAAAAGRDRCLQAAHGRRAGAGTAHRLDPGRTGLGPFRHTGAAHTQAPSDHQGDL